DVETPVVLSVSPAYGTVGTEVRIEGTGFAANLEVRFDDLKSPRVLRQGGALFAVAPSGLTPGRSYRVQVLNEGTRADSADLTFTTVAPSIGRVNGVTRPTGLRGMTLILEGSAFSDSVGLSRARVFWRAADGSTIPAVIADTVQDWTDSFIVTTVPQEIGETSLIWIETPTGKSDSVEFRIIQNGLFSPSQINWTRTTSLPRPLHALGAVFTPVENGPSPANYVFVAGGADSLAAAVASVYRATVQQSGALEGNWSEMSALPEPRAYHALAAATPFTAAVDTATTAAFLYVLGGLDSAGQPSSGVWFARVALDGSTGVWQATTALPAPLRAPTAIIFAGYIYVAGGANAGGMAQKGTYRARIQDDGTLGPWQSSLLLPEPLSHGALVSFGPFLYAVGGETAVTTPLRASQTGSETSQVYMSRIDLRSRDLAAPGWSTTGSMNKARSKHGAIFAGGSLLVTSGIYAGNPGSSENSYANISSTGALGSWNGATGSETIDVELGMSLYNQAVVTFIDRAGFGHVLVLGGADRQNEGRPSAGVVRY
ncbi:MAG: IPT/TIG domain-containing protein, partial [Longimicrobiales bacterium]